MPGATALGFVRSVPDAPNIAVLGLESESRMTDDRQDASPTDKMAFSPNVGFHSWQCGRKQIGQEICTEGVRSTLDASFPMSQKQT